LLLQIGVVASVRQWLLARQNPMSAVHFVEREEVP